MQAIPVEGTYWVSPVTELQPLLATIVSAFRRISARLGSRCSTLARKMKYRRGPTPTNGRNGTLLASSRPTEISSGWRIRRPTLCVRLDVNYFIYAGGNDVPRTIVTRKGCGIENRPRVRCVPTERKRVTPPSQHERHDRIQLYRKTRCFQARPHYARINTAAQRLHNPVGHSLLFVLVESSPRSTSRWLGLAAVGGSYSPPPDFGASLQPTEIRSPWESMIAAPTCRERSPERMMRRKP